ncbi:MAG: bacteriohemerythrin [Magnetococcales bacterium]|nr:bacteriohemerythrin [Magnetococcales bacterium]
MANQENIKKIAVAKGIWWIEIAEANLRVLCGCPMDSVKHLTKRGLIFQTEKAGVPCEGGPNAVLLSDTMLQNGDFANLGEFPVLQMLYKQGLILPKHPNNTGQKPLLIGSPEQVKAQLQYIYRGNYGLISEEEIIEAGCAADQARQLMRLKLRFAFGTIRQSRDFLDSCIVGEAAVEIRQGVMIRRLAQNCFEFSYAGEQVTVDLNLPEGEHYESAYPLGFQCLSREYFSIIHAGEGDGWDVNRPSMSSILMFQGKIYLIDAGPNLFYNLSALGIDVNEIEGVFQTHAHDDHFAGITTLIRAGQKIKFYAAPLVRATVSKKMAALLAVEEEWFEEFFEVHDLPEGEWSDLDGLEVMPMFSPHPVESTIFLFRTLWDDGYRSYAHFADLVALDVLQGMIEEDERKPGIRRADFERIKENYLTPVNLKKLDVGGGMIHGMAKDFREDRSDRILLSHLSRPLTPAEKEIGSSAPYGMVDNLIIGQSDFARRSAFSFLQSALPSIPLHSIRTLLNNPVLDFNPGVILLKEGEIPQNLYLVLTGAVEKIRTSANIFSRLTIGTLVGELAALNNVPAHFTHSTACFVRALRIPVALYRELVRRHGLGDVVKHTREERDYLESTDLFNEGLTPHLLVRIVMAMRTRHFHVGETITYEDHNYLNVIRSGRVARMTGGREFEILEAGSHFGEEWSIFNTPPMFRLIAKEAVECSQIPANLLQNIPIVRWKLRDIYTRRIRQALHPTAGIGAFCWQERYEVGLLQMDLQHRKLLEIFSAIVELFHCQLVEGIIERAFETLFEVTGRHFMAEERLMERYGYAGVTAHRRQHALLMRQLDEYRFTMQQPDAHSAESFQAFIDQWLLKHIVEEDRHYSAFLNERGAY